MTNEELINTIQNDEILLNNLIDSYAQEYLDNEQSEDAPMPLDEDNISVMAGNDCLNAICRAFFGSRFNYENDNFNPNDEFFYVNAYGNFVSIRDKNDLHDYIVSILDTESFLQYCIDNDFVNEDIIKEDN